MPFWHRSDHKDEQLQAQPAAPVRNPEEIEAERKASIEALAAGGIPLRAQRRLDDLRTRGTFTSDLSVNEAFLARQSGVKPITQVMGACFYSVRRWYRPNGDGEVVELRAWNDARGLALDRMTKEAERVGAHAVIGVHLTINRYDWTEGSEREYLAVGTAVQVERLPEGTRLGPTHLSGQDFWKLYRAGWWPIGVVHWNSVYYVYAGARHMDGTYENVELTDSSEGLRQAARLTMDQLHTQAQQLGATGVVGVDVDQYSWENEVDLGNDQVRRDLVCELYALGTAVTRLPTKPESLVVQTMVPLDT